MVLEYCHFLSFFFAKKTLDQKKKKVTKASLVPQCFVKTRNKHYGEKNLKVAEGK